eukprot:1004479-Prymnesium_polylepis.1
MGLGVSPSSCMFSSSLTRGLASARDRAWHSCDALLDMRCGDRPTVRLGGAPRGSDRARVRAAHGVRSVPYVTYSAQLVGGRRGGVVVRTRAPHVSETPTTRVRDATRGARGPGRG